MGPTWGPPGTDRTQVCPMCAPWTLLSELQFQPKLWYIYKTYSYICQIIPWWNIHQLFPLSDTSMMIDLMPFSSLAWWCLDMETLSLLLAICVGKPPTTGIQIARFIGPSWGHLGPTGPRWAPCWPHELCYLGSFSSERAHNVGSMAVMLRFNLFLSAWMSCWTNSWVVDDIRCQDSHVTLL